MILACQNICKAFGDNESSKMLHFHTKSGESRLSLVITVPESLSLFKNYQGEMAATDGQTVINKVPLRLSLPSTRSAEWQYDFDELHDSER